jgi:hypothetical protein
VTRIYRFPATRPHTPGAPISEPYDGSVLSLGSDAPPNAWILSNGQIDFSLVNRIVLAIMGALTAGGRPAAAVHIGRRWAHVSDGVFDESLMPACMAAAPKAGVDVQPFAASLSRVCSPVFLLFKDPCTTCMLWYSQLASNSESTDSVIASATS